MKKIEFGFSNGIEPNGSYGSWEGIGIKLGLMLTEADYYGIVSYDGNSYMVAKVTEDKYGRYPDLVGKFIVRDALPEVYADGSGFLLLDQEESHIGKQIENYLNMEQIKNNINNLDDIYKYLNRIGQANRIFALLEMDEDIKSTSIRHEVFENKNEALKNCTKSFSNMQLRLNELENSKHI